VNIVAFIPQVFNARRESKRSDILQGVDCGYWLRSHVLQNLFCLGFHFTFLLQLDFFQVWWGAGAPRVALNNGARLVQLTIVHHAADRGGGVTH